MYAAKPDIQKSIAHAAAMSSGLFNSEGKFNQQAYYSAQYLLALAALQLPRKWLDIHSTILHKICSSPEKQESLTNLQDYWRRSISRPRVSPDFGYIASKFISDFVQTMNESLNEVGLDGHFSLPKFALFHKDAMPGKGGYDSKDEMIYQSCDYPGFRNPIYGFNWLTHEAQHHVHHQLTLAAPQGRLDRAESWLQEATAIFDWRRTMPQTSQPPLSGSLANAIYALMPTEVDAMLMGDSAAMLYANVKDPRMLTSFHNNPEQRHLIGQALHQAQTSRITPEVMKRASKLLTPIT